MKPQHPYDVGGILDDLRDGLPYDEIMERHRVSRSLVSRLAIDNGLRRNRRKALRCPECGGTIWAGDLCRGCRAKIDKLVSVEELTGGQWVLDPRRRIQVWRAAS